MTEIYALDLDEEFLSHLADPDSFIFIKSENLSPELIEDDEVGEIYLWQLRHAQEHGRPATATVLADEFDIDFAEPETTIGDLVDRLRARWLKNVGRKRLEVIGETYREDPEQLPKVMANIARELTDRISPRGELFGTGDFDRAMELYNKKVLKGSGVLLGHQALTDHFFELIGVNFVIAPPKTYKSWEILGILLENVLAGKCVELDSLELPAEEADMRLRCLAAGVPFWRYIKNMLSEEHKASLKEASEFLDSCGTYRIAKPPKGERGIHRMVDTARDRGAEVVLIDQLQYVENEKGKSLGSLNDTGHYWDVLNDARDLSDDGPIVFAHQFNRQTMFAESMPEIQYAKGSSAIEEIATLALGIWGNKDMRRSNVLEIGTLISRNHTFAAWHLGIELSKGCKFEIIGPADDE